MDWNSRDNLFHTPEDVWNIISTETLLKLMQKNTRLCQVTMASLMRLLCGKQTFEVIEIFFTIIFGK